MFYHDKRLQYSVRVNTPDPIFARMLQHAIDGMEGEIRVCMQYLFQSWGSCEPDPKYRDGGDRPHGDADDRGGAQPQ